jgi:hypothetical protein
LEAKFAALVDPVLGSERTARLITGIAGLDASPDVREIVRMCAL